jgi:hypothetical protein
MASTGYSTPIVPACSNFNVALTVPPLLERMFEREQHHVIAARLKRDGFAGLDFQAAFHGAHFHHPPSIVTL